MKTLISFLLLATVAQAQFTNAKKIQGVPVAPTAPSDGQALCFASATGLWTPAACTNAGPTGAAGANGAGYTATSTTSLATAGSGSKSFTTQSGLAYTVGARIRATAAASGEYMEGVVTSYSSTTLVATMDLNSGTGTHTDWNINLAGNRGSAGATGATGATGPAGSTANGVNWVRPETYGAVGDCVADDTTAIQSALDAVGSTSISPTGGGSVVLKAGACYLTSATLNISRSYVNLFGEGMGMSQSVIKSNSATADIIKINGSGDGNCASGGIYWSSIKYVDLRRSTNGTTTSKGINITKGCWTEIDQVQAVDSISNIYIHLSGNTSIHRIQTAWSNSSATARYGIEIDSDSGTVNNTTWIDHAVIDGTSGSNITGAYVHGDCIADLTFSRFQTAGAKYGIHFVSTSNASTFAYCNGDVQVNNPIMDTTTNTGILVENVYGLGSAGIVINGGFIGTDTSGGIAVDIESSQGVGVIGTQLRAEQSSGIGVKIAGANSASNRIVGTQIQMAPTGILLSSTTNNLISGNNFTSVSGHPFTDVIKLLSATNNIITGNTLTQYATTGINLDSSSNSNKIYPNRIDPTNITTPITDAGTANDFGDKLSCQPGIGDGVNSIAAATYLQSTCYNTTGATVTITGIKCFTDNSGTSTLAATNGAGTALLTGAVTCTTAFAAGTQSATVTIAAGDFIKFTFVADGTSKQSTWVVTEKKP